jgi:hypothetical protein
MKKNLFIFLLSCMCSYVQAQRPQVGQILQASSVSLGNFLTDDFNSIMFDGIQTTLSSMNSAAELHESLDALSSSECVPDFNETSNTRMSYQCAPASECQECFTNARMKMDFFRRQLARLNCIYQDTKNFTTNAIALGDNMSGIHAMAGMAWQNERSKINANFTKLKRTYDTRYLEFIKGLKDALMEFDACENKYGQGDWFQKTGFIYFEMMKERYKRND